MPSHDKIHLQMFFGKSMMLIKHYFYTNIHFHVEYLQTRKHTLKCCKASFLFFYKASVVLHYLVRMNLIEQFEHCNKPSIFGIF